MAQWVDVFAAHAPQTVWVNLSTSQFLDDAVLASVDRVLVRSGIEASQLGVEITETALLTDTPRAHAVLGRLTDLGIRVAIDEFGTGLSSLLHLKRLGIHVLKLRRDSLADVAASSLGADLLSGAVGTARALGCDVIAEGIEDDQQLRIARDLGCSIGQGYLFGWPRATSDFEGLLVDQLRADLPLS